MAEYVQITIFNTFDEYFQWFSRVWYNAKSEIWYSQNTVAVNHSRWGGKSMSTPSYRKYRLTPNYIYDTSYFTSVLLFDFTEELEESRPVCDDDDDDWFLRRPVSLSCGWKFQTFVYIPIVFCITINMITFQNNTRNISTHIKKRLI